MAVLILTGTAIGACAEMRPPCDAPEIVANQSRYNHEVCSGITMMEQGNNRDAIVHFEEALRMNLLELPNFYLLPRLALAYSYTGAFDRSQELLQAAELSLRLYTRLLQCKYYDDGYSIVRVVGGRTYKVHSPVADQVVSMMCGEAYDYIYETDDLTAILRDAELVEHYLSIKRSIVGRQQRVDK